TEVHHEELKTIESGYLERQQQHSLSFENTSKENEESIVSGHSSGTKWCRLEVRQKRNSEEKNPCFEQPVLQVSRFSPPETTARRNTTPSNSTLNNYMACFSTPVVNNDFLPGRKVTTPYTQFSYMHPRTLTTPFQMPSGLQVSASAPSNECIFIKGKWYSVLKQIGRGGSSKVFQVLDEKKHLRAIKYVNLEEADQQTIESYKNEIVHLNKLQQHSDKIIRLHDYEINEKSIYMVMECGNIDLNSWLKKKKTINPWERKSYWKNMLEAVHTIHQHGIYQNLYCSNQDVAENRDTLVSAGTLISAASD
ncbi:UNVERIFIED_CONTAM: hypothetical protein K2H54_065481, partial [Gekko kuhli]